MLWLALIFLVVGVLLHDKSKKENNSIMKTISIIVMVIGGLLCVLAIAIVGAGIFALINLD